MSVEELGKGQQSAEPTSAPLMLSFQLKSSLILRHPPQVGGSKEDK